ncbi:UBP-type zinc finger domain-containing protein [Krasilnikoviella flava]|uniref:Ubiquitin-hydrolase Zn-finger-containing protein n=1 Tax=Krasilnikoviella flava TaxID=526729 RepID=A0A1T5K8F3_9MICO|nr:ubiquitin-hydrolase Zn-finger-containing protein [Krasilnikoviella flava]
MTSTCTHLDQIDPVAPETLGECPECVTAGGTWVHLRACLECGHVGCCDSSPARHATAHFHATAHPVMRSIEPGEHWGYCFPEDLLVPGRDMPGSVG